MRVAGIERLRVLEGLAPLAKRLRIYGDASAETSGWELVCDTARFHLVLSPDVWRGFSGEGQALTALAGSDWEAALPRVRAALKWEAVIDVPRLSRQTGLSDESLRAALAALGARGLVGFDLGEGAYFHRELPFDLSLVEALQPRLQGARKLLAAGGVRLGERTEEQVELFVAGSGVEHRVRLTAAGTSAPVPGSRSTRANAAPASTCWRRKCSWNQRRAEACPTSERARWRMTKSTESTGGMSHERAGEVTREQLEAVLARREKAAACVRLFAQATEENRRALAPVAVAWLRTIWSAWLGPKRRAEVELPKDIRPHLLREAAQVAVLATATLAELRRLPAFASRDWALPPDMVFDVLSARRPEWIDEWAELYVEQAPDNWAVVRRLVRAGVCRPSLSDAMICGMMACVDGYRTTIRESLLADPELLEQEVWRLFEVQRGNSLNFASRDEYRQPALVRVEEEGQPVRFQEGAKAKGWLETFVELAQEGRLSRDRLLEASLAAVEREFPDSQSRWFPKLHEALQPSPAERQAFLPRYLGLLGSRNGSTLTFVLDILKTLDQAGQLPDDDVLQHIGPVLLDRTKARAKQALKLLERLAARRSDLASRTALLATQALTHETVDVQEAAWRLIDRLGTSCDAELGEAVRAAQDAIAPSLRERVAKWLGTQDLPRVTVVSTPSGGWEELVRTAETLDSRLAAAAGIPELLAAIRSGATDLPRADLQTWGFPRLRESIGPLATLDDLIDAAAAALEGVDSADEVEQILDGVSRLCDQRPDDFERRTGPLRKRTLEQPDATRTSALFRRRHRCRPDRRRVGLAHE